MVIWSFEVVLCGFSACFSFSCCDGSGWFSEVLVGCMVVLDGVDPGGPALF